MFDKEQILKHIYCGNKKDAAIKYGFSLSGLSTIFKNCQEILAQSEEMEKTS